MPQDKVVIYVTSITVFVNQFRGQIRLTAGKLD